MANFISSMHLCWQKSDINKTKRQKRSDPAHIFIFRLGRYTVLFYAIIPTFLPSFFFLFCYPYIFCLGTRMPRHSAGGIGGPYVCVYVRGTYHLQVYAWVHGMYYLQVYAWVIEAENSITLTISTSTNVFITPRWCSKNDYLFVYEYTYQDCEYIRVLGHSKNICDQVA